MLALRDRSTDFAESCREQRILICEPSPAAGATILHALDATGALAERTTGFPSLDDLRRAPRCGSALVALKQSFPDGSSELELIDYLRHHGITVIGYEAGLNSWPLARRCRFLLRGCSHLLDSSSRDFALELRRAIDRSVRVSEETPARDRQLTASMAAQGVVGESRAMLDIFASVARISALSDLPTLITGESGTGKDLLARAIHARDPKRSSGPFVALNCSAIPSTLAETELFGHRKGAFTGADRDRRGLFRAAHGGVLFLDEIAELGLDIQVKLLRVLQDSRVTSVGDEHETPVNVRVIAATNGDLREMVDRRTFRGDLFHRLNVVSIHIPPLRDRRADIRPLVEHFVRQHHALNPAASRAIAVEFVDALGHLELPGNARQIENLVRSALVHNDGTSPLGLPDLPPDVWQQLAEEPPAASTAPGVVAEESLGMLEAHGWNLSRTLDACERSLLQAAFRASDGNQAKTARLLGITPRSVYNKRRRHHIA